MERIVLEEGNQSQKLAASLEGAQTEQRELYRCLRVVEQELDAERAEHAASKDASREVLTSAARERLDTLAIVEQLRAHGRGTSRSPPKAQPKELPEQSSWLSSSPMLSHEGL